MLGRAALAPAAVRRRFFTALPWKGTLSLAEGFNLPKESAYWIWRYEQ
jgi:hypothetical protein